MLRWATTDPNGAHRKRTATRSVDAVRRCDRHPEAAMAECLDDRRRAVPGDREVATIDRISRRRWVLARRVVDGWRATCHSRRVRAMEQTTRLAVRSDDAAAEPDRVEDRERLEALQDGRPGTESRPHRVDPGGDRRSASDATSGGACATSVPITASPARARVRTSAVRIAEQATFQARRSDATGDGVQAMWHGRHHRLADDASIHAAHGRSTFRRLFQAREVGDEVVELLPFELVVGRHPVVLRGHDLPLGSRRGPSGTRRESEAGPVWPPMPRIWWHAAQPCSL